MAAVELSYAVPERHRPPEHGAAISSILCAAVPVAGIAFQSGPTFLSGLILMPFGMIMGLHGVLSDRSTVLGIIGTSLNGLGALGTGYVLLMRGLC